MNKGARESERERERERERVNNAANHGVTLCFNRAWIGNAVSLQMTVSLAITLQRAKDECWEFLVCRGGGLLGRGRREGGGGFGRRGSWSHHDTRNAPDAFPAAEASRIRTRRSRTTRYVLHGRHHRHHSLQMWLCLGRRAHRSGSVGLETPRWAVLAQSVNSPNEAVTPPKQVDCCFDFLLFECNI